MNDIPAKKQEEFAKRIKDVLEGKPGFLMVGNDVDGEIHTSIMVQRVSTGNLAIAVIQALWKPIAEAQERAKKK